jgi:hypothetical protein
MPAVSLAQGVSAAAMPGTQTPISNASNVAATQAFVNQQILYETATVPLSGITGGTISQFSAGSGAQFVIFVVSGAISSVLSIVTGGSGYAVGDSFLVNGGNYDARLLVTNVSGGVIQSGGLQLLYGGTGYSTGATTGSTTIPIGQRFITLAGVLTSNLTYILSPGNYNTASRRPVFANNTTGAFTVTVKLSDGAGSTVGTGVVLTQGTNNSTAQLLVTDGVNDVWKVA